MKKLIIVLVAALTVNLAQAAYLYWQVDTDDYKDDVEVSTPAYARVVAVDGEGKTTALGIAGGDGSTMINVDSGRSVVSLDTLTDPTAYSFFIEVLNYNSASDSFDAVAKSASETYATLQRQNFIDVGEVMQLPPVEVWHGGSFSAVPEPTGGLLVMFGLGLLALKRKRV